MCLNSSFDNKNDNVLVNSAYSTNTFTHTCMRKYYWNMIIRRPVMHGAAV